MATLDRDGPARHRAARISRRARGGRQRPWAAGVGLGGRGATPGHRGACGPWRPRDPCQALAAAAGPSCGPGSGRLDQPARPELHLATVGSAARGGLRRRHVLCAVLDETAAARGGPCLRRHRLPDRGGGADLRRPGASRGAGGRGGSRRAGRLVALAVPGPVRPRAGGHDHQRGRPGDRHVRSPGRRRRDPQAAGRDDRDAPPARRPASRRLRRSSPATDRRRRSWLPGRLPGQRRVQRAREGPRDRPRSRGRRGHRLEADGPRRCGVPDRSEVGRGGEPARPAPLPGLQRG